MGFKYWYEGAVFVLMFGTLILIPCFFIARIGTKMVNDVGNFPTKSSSIQVKACWKVLLIELFTFAFLAAFFQIFN